MRALFHLWRSLDERPEHLRGLEAAVLGAAQEKAETGASRAAVQRNLDVLTARGLAREVTGQGRFRVWAATG